MVAAKKKTKDHYGWSVVKQGGQILVCSHEGFEQGILSGLYPVYSGSIH